MLIRKTREDDEETKHYEQQTVPTQQSILKLEEAAQEMQRSVDELKPFEVINNYISRIYSSEYFSIDLEVSKIGIKYKTALSDPPLQSYRFTVLTHFWFLIF